ncbi:sorting nexin-17 isoform X2 [Sitophilus oryzae]|uniref:Sorting nexin-17 isoform X2 n=1 Tax=Sitophilus oryzae TaxID=7048 RepID=A0A6J2XBE9_SITOR|nr:sorting nexin-17 isoform X2 [Sitophilus oryzae]
MHFSIPDTQELNEGNGSTFIGYNIHINGVFHCTVRYKQLHNLNEQLKKEFGNDIVPCFPPKKILPLTSGQLEERRALLEKYIQTVGQDSKLVSSELLSGFLRSAQQETACQEKQDINLDIYTMTNYPIKIRACTYDRTEYVLWKALKQINLPHEYVQYFSLYLIKVGSNGDVTVIRKLLDLESPYLTQQIIRTATRIVIRKGWDKNYDSELMTDPVAMNLLYLQTMFEVENGWIITNRENKMQLDKIKSRLAKKEYIEFAQKLKYYGFMQFCPCYCDYPQAQTKVLVAIGDEELSLRILKPGNVVTEGLFKVTRMRCWRIVATNNKHTYPENESYSNNVSNNSALELSFEYLMSKDNLQWITITSEQAILMSVCLQSLVDELLIKKNGTKKIEPVRNHGKWTYMKRDGSCQLISSENSGLSHSDDLEGQSETNFQEPFSIKKLQEKFSSVSFKSGREFIENHAFEGIGDEDL